MEIALLLYSVIGALISSIIILYFIEKAFGLTEMNKKLGDIEQKLDAALRQAPSALPGQQVIQKPIVSQQSQIVPSRIPRVQNYPVQQPQQARQQPLITPTQTKSSQNIATSIPQTPSQQSNQEQKTSSSPFQHNQQRNQQLNQQSKQKNKKSKGQNARDFQQQDQSQQRVKNEQQYNQFGQRSQQSQPVRSPPSQVTQQQTQSGTPQQGSIKPVIPLPSSQPVRTTSTGDQGQENQSSQNEVKKPILLG